MAATHTEHRPGRLRFCNGTCHDSYRTDRRYGVIYGSVEMSIDPPIIASWEDAMTLGLRCCYCSAYVPTNTGAIDAVTRP